MTTNQMQLGLETTGIDLSRFVTFQPHPGDTYCRVGGGPRGRRAQQIGVILGTIGLRHASGYEVLVRFPDGKIDSFTPFDLYPAEPEAAAAHTAERKAKRTRRARSPATSPAAIET